MHEKRTTVHYRVRREDASLSDYFFPWGLLALLFILLPLIYGLMWYAKNGIEKSVKAEVEQELMAEGFDWVDVDVDGQVVTLSGEASKTLGDQALSTARSVERPAWLGSFSVPSKVQGNFSEPKVAEVEPEVETATAPEPVETEPVLVWGNFISELSNGELTLSGTVGSDQDKQSLLDYATAQMASSDYSRVIDQIKVSTLNLEPSSQAISLRTIEVMSKCMSGEARSYEGRFSTNCQTNRDQVQNLETIAKQPFEMGEIGAVVISASNECNELFKQTLEGKSIGFRVGKADLKASSDALLKQVADIAKTCPGNIRVEGHTDVSGNFDANMALSDARANSVVIALVDLGLDRERLIPKGFGSTKPRAQGNSAEAYALNRRIEFHVSE